MVILLQLITVILFPPLMLGFINRTKAVFAGRQGPPLIQPYYEIWRLLHKGCVQSTVTTWLFRAGPVVAFVTSTLAALFIPVILPFAAISFPGDLIVFLYLFALGRLLLVLSSLDTGSAFEGMGVAREITFACMAEPAMLMGLLALIKVTGSLQLSDLLVGLHAAKWTVSGAPLLLILTSWFLLMLADSCRIPFDDPNTHLELTMVHEVIILDHSGPMLALLQLAAAQKLFISAVMIVRVALPHFLGSSWFGGLFCLAGVLLVAILVGIVESVMARVRMLLVPHVLTAAGVAAAFGLILQVTIP